MVLCLRRKVIRGTTFLGGGSGWVGREAGDQGERQLTDGCADLDFDLPQVRLTGSLFLGFLFFVF